MVCMSNLHLSRDTLRMEQPFLALHLRELAIFTAICERGSLTLAARDVGITPSGVSHALAHLEKHFGGALLDRARRPVAPTVLGDIVRHHADILIRQAKVMDAEVRLGVDAPLPNLRIGLIDSLAIHFLPHFIHGSKGQIRAFSVATDFNSGLRRRLQDRTLDLLIAAGRFDDATGIERYDVIDEPILMLLPKGSPELSDTSAFKAYALETPFIRNSLSSDLGKQIDRQLRRMRIEPEYVFAFDSVDSVSAMVAGGFGWAMMPATSVARSPSHLAAIDLRRFPGPAFRRPITIIARSGELGTLPAKIAEVSRNVFRKVYLPKFRELMPWILPEVHLH
jgi:DNA-binding transcriptional LysR family regulator